MGEGALVYTRAQSSDDIVRAAHAVLKAARRTHVRCIRQRRIKRSRYFTLAYHLDSSDQAIERGIETVMIFENLSGKVTLYLMRQAYERQIWRKRGFDDFEAWAHTRFNQTGMSADTIQRYCNVIEKIIAPLDAVPMLVDGHSVDGLILLAQSNPTSLQKVSGLYSRSDEANQATLLRGLTSGTSDYREIKASVGWSPTIGKWPASFIQVLDTATGEVYWQAQFPRMTQEQMDYTYRSLAVMLNVTVKPYEQHQSD